MVRTKPSPQQVVRATLIGDVVASRDVADRADLHRRVQRLLTTVNEALRPDVPLRITVGDEYQGCFGTVGEAVRAALLLRLGLHPAADLRHGIGWGPVSVLQQRPRVEDGPGWWSARDAIEWVASQADRSSLRLLRTAYRRAEDCGGPAPEAVNAALVCRDQMVGSLSERSWRLLRGALEGRTRAELAEAEGVSPSAVSQRFRHDGLAALLAAEELLGGVR
jgi:hypothetical protein